MGPMTLQRCTQQEQFNRLLAPSFTFWRPWGFEHTTPTPVAWIEISSRRLSLRQQQQQLLQPPGLPAVPLTAVADCAHHTAEARAQSFRFSVGSTASQVGATADMVDHPCIAVNGQQLVTVPSVLHEWVVPPHFLCCSLSRDVPEGVPGSCPHAI